MLFVPGGANSFAAIESNASGRPSATQGTAVTPAVGSKGAWAQCIASLSADTFGLLICINSNAASAASRNSVVDVGIGTAGNEVVLIPDLIAGNASGYSSSGMWYWFPVTIPAGTRVAVRSQGTVTTAFRVFVQALQKPGNPSQFKKASYVEAIGMTVPQGTTIPVGTTSEGAWTLLGTTTQDCWHWQVAGQVSSADTSHVAAAVHMDLAVGDGTNFQILMDSVLLCTSTAEFANMSLAVIPCEMFVPAGSSIYARAQSSGNADTFFMAAYGAGG